MRKIVIILMGLGLLPLFSIAQDSSLKIHEVGINVSGLTSFGVRFRSGSEKTLLRVTLVSFNGTNLSSKTGSSPTSNVTSLGIGCNLGFERRKIISSNSTFYYGSDFLASYTMNSHDSGVGNNSLKTWTLSSGVGLVLGFLYKINSNINISAEVVPSISYLYGKSYYIGTIYSKETNTGFNFGLGTSGANITLSFRFGNNN